MKSINYKILIIFITFLVLLNISTISMARDPDLDDQRAQEAYESGPYGLKRFENGEDPTSRATKGISETIISVVRVIGVTVALVILLVIAMKYMISAPGDRADIKKHAVAYLVGAFILFGGSTILGILVKVAEVVK